MITSKRMQPRPSRPLARMAIYLSFTGLSGISLWWVLHQLKESGTVIMVIGAAELAYAFYAFSTGNSAYSMLPSLPKSAEDIREYVLEKAARLIRAGRSISVGAIFLILTGISLTGMDAPYAGLSYVVLLTSFLLEYGLDSYGA